MHEETGGAAAGVGLAAVLFDMDGLLIDSERLWLEVETGVMDWLGGSWGPEQQEQMVGGSLDVAVRLMLEHTGADAAPEEVARRMVDGMVERLSASVPMMPGAKELLAEVQAAGVPAALVSSSYRRLLEPVLDALGREHFVLTVAGDEVARPKPDPEPYLKATAALGVPPGRCVVLEDSPNGLAAAEAAGCRTVAVPGLLPIREAPGRVVVASLCEIDLAGLSAMVG
ncbi:MULTISPECIES: HAD family hydrolase [Thermomonosporaceae]|uniref:HAD family hydrolase n=1 Tax=Thermomonosporaceae TaxID=2012 RepID=UPI00255A9456|nr:MULTISPECIES: HAD family phosphatase [Thermomonosporaceae]MDL4777036.1 HAD family phosphatase [Actinomadura xylanilytica]